MNPILAAGACPALFGCLPADTRPDPARLEVNVQLSAELTAPTADPRVIVWTTSDGWVTTVDRLLVSMGRVRFSGDGCNEYAEAGYGRIVNLLQPDPQKLGQLFGLNECRLAYSAFRPNSDAVLGVEVTLDEHQFLQYAFVPTSSPTGVGQKQGMALYLRGKAEKEGVSVNFDWGFADELNWTDCQRQIDGALENTLRLESGDALTIGITIDPRSLFRLYPESDEDTGAASLGGLGDLAASSLMQAIADADQISGDANGHVSIDELWATSVPSDIMPPNLAELIRQRGYSSMFRYDGNGYCVVGAARTRGHRM